MQKSGRGDPAPSTPTPSTRGRGFLGAFKNAYLLDFSAAFIGIGVFRFWYQYNLYNLHFSTDYGVEIAWINILRAGVIALLLICAARAELPLRARSFLVWFSLILMTASSTIHFFELTTGNASLELARYITCGVGLVWGGGMWMDFFCRLKPTRAFLYLACGLALSCLLSLLGGYISEYAMGLVGLFVPAFAVLAYWYAMHLLDAEEKATPPAPQTDRRYSELYRGDLVQIGLALCMFAFAMGIALGFPDGNPRELSQTVRTIHQLALILVLTWLVYYVLVRGHALRFTSIWYFENLLIMASIILLVSDTPGINELGTAGILSAESFFYTFVFFTSYDMGRRTHRASMYILGILYGGSLLCMGAGRLLSTWMSSLSDGTVFMVLTMSSLAIVDLVLAIRLDIFKSDIPLFADVAPSRPLSWATSRGSVAGSAAPVVSAANATSEASDIKLPASRADEDPVMPRLQSLREQKGLTEVEMRIADLMAHGRSRSFIAHELGYSENTIRNYTRTLYQKLDVHGKQELIDLIGGEVAQF